MKLRNAVLFRTLVIVSIVFLSTCKDSSPVEFNSGKKSLLVDKTWQSQKVYELITGSPVDITNQSGIGYFRLSSDGTFTSSMLNGTWELSADETKIAFKNGSYVIIAEILELSDKTLRLIINLPNNIPPSILDVALVPNVTPNTLAPEANFEDLWKQFDLRYSFFEIKRIDWDSVYSVYRPRVTSATTYPELFKIMSDMLATLKDGHVNLTTPYGAYGYTGWYDKYPVNFPGTSVITQYLSKDYGTTAGGYLRYGKIQNEIGYIYMGPYLNGDSYSWTNAIDMIIDTLKNMRGIIVDIRNNGGGNDGLGNIVAGRFDDRQRVYSYIRWRNGPKHSDFTDYSPATISPQGSRQFLKPVAFLTNRRCFSSAEGTTLMFRVLPNVTIIGDTTGGGSANPLTLPLPNGWTYRVSRWIQYTADKTIFEGKGLPPDMPVQISAADAAAGKDLILERAVQLLKSK